VTAVSWVGDMIVQWLMPGWVLLCTHDHTMILRIPHKLERKPCDVLTSIGAVVCEDTLGIGHHDVRCLQSRAGTPCSGRCWGAREYVEEDASTSGDVVVVSCGAVGVHGVLCRMGEDMGGILPLAAERSEGGR
jgi:hypothetical protein